MPWLQELPAALLSVAAASRVPGGMLLEPQGRRPSVIYCVVQGELRLVRHTKHGFTAVLQRVRQGFVAEASLYVATYHCDLVASEDSELVTFPVRSFRQTLAENQAFAAWWASSLAREVRRLRLQVERLCLQSARDRVLHCVEAEGVDGVFVLKQTKKAWAAELGLTHEALYRTLRRLVDEGVLTVDGNALRLGALR